MADSQSPKPQSSWSSARAKDNLLQRSAAVAVGRRRLSSVVGGHIRVPRVSVCVCVGAGGARLGATCGSPGVSPPAPARVRPRGAPKVQTRSFGRRHTRPTRQNTHKAHTFMVHRTKLSKQLNTKECAYQGVRVFFFNPRGAPAQIQPNGLDLCWGPPGLKYPHKRELVLGGYILKASSGRYIHTSPNPT